MDEIKRLKRLLEGQQRQLRTTRQEYAAALYSRTELQRFLKQCLLDIRQEIDKQTKPQYAQVIHTHPYHHPLYHTPTKQPLANATPTGLTHTHKRNQTLS